MQLNSSLDFEDPSNVNVASEYNLLVVATDKNDTSLKGESDTLFTAVYCE